MSTPTTHHGWPKPDVDADTLAQYMATGLTAALDGIDQAVKDVEDDVAALAGAAGGAASNLLTNPGLEVWQRGTGAFTTNQAYAADRWQIALGGSSTLSVSRDTANVDTGSGFCAACTYVHNAETYLRQKLEDYLQLRGRQVTFAVRVKTSTANAVRLAVDTTGGGALAYSSYHTGSGAYQTLSVTATVSASATGCTAYLVFNASCTAYADNATLYPGPVAVPYAPLPVADDVLRCQRYYEVLFGVNDLGFRGYQVAGSPIYQTVSYQAEKAVTPTVTKNGTWIVSNCGQPAMVATSRRQLMIGITATATGELYTLVNSADDTFVAEANP